MHKVHIITFPQKGFEWHDEDAWRVSKRFPIYAVADGVTLSVKNELETPHGSKPAAELFCKNTIEFLEKKFEKLSRAAFRDAYAYANKAVRGLNKNYKTPLSTVGTVLAVQDGIIFGSRVTDCGFALIREGKLIFKTPEYWSWRTRNNIKGYGVIDGKSKGLRYINYYQKPHRAGDMVLLFSDGFENHFKEKNFVNVFCKRNMPTIETMLASLDREIVDRGEQYGHERTLLIVEL